MKSKKASKSLERRDFELLDKILDKMGQLLLWTICYGVLGTTDKKRAKDLETRLKKLRQRGKEFSPTKIPKEDHELNNNFFQELHDLLIEFSDEELWKEFDRRRAKRFAEIALGYEKIANRKEDLL